MPRRSLGRASLVLLGSTWTHSALSLLISVMVGRVLGPSALGELALNLGLTGVVMAVLLPGLALAHLKRVAEGQDAGRCLGTMLAFQVALAAVLVLGLAVAWALGALVGFAGGTIVFVLMLSSQVAGRFSDAFLKVLVARQWVVAHGAVLLGGRLARLVVTALVLVAVPRVSWVAATLVFEAALTCVAAALVLAAAGIRPRWPTRASLGEYWRYAAPFLVTTPLAHIQDSIDRVLVGWWGGLTAVGFYNVARGLWEALAGVMAPPGLMMFTRLSSLYAQRSPERDAKARALFFRGFDKLLFVSTPLAVGFWVLAGPLITVPYGDAFLPATPTLRVLVVAALIATIVNPYTYVLQAQDEVGRFVRLNVARFAVYVTALAALVRGLVPGIPGGEFGASVARLLLVGFLSWRWIGWTAELAGIPFYWRLVTIYLTGFAVAVVTFHAGGALGAHLGGPGLAADAAAAVGAGVVYTLWLLKLHPDTRANVDYAMALLSPARRAD